MNEIEFKNWLINNGTNRKVTSDIISRLKRIERQIDQCDIDEQYRIDQCNYLLELFSKSGQNDEMKKYKNTNFPIGKYQMNTFRYALKKYIIFCNTYYFK